ncbi:uncharacterized protein LOC118336621 [Tachysurus ichikawai]
MDACVTLTKDICDLISNHLETINQDYNDQLEKERFLIDNITQKKDGHYEMPLPFKGNSPPNLPNNKRLATVRLQCLKKKLKTNKQYYNQYKTFMEETINKGDAKPAATTSEGETEWYLPHHGIYHPRKPDKLRVVFDCLAKFHGVSLTGPDLINPLVGVFCRFRKEAVAIICDIERSFISSPSLLNPGII